MNLYLNLYVEYEASLPALVVVDASGGAGLVVVHASLGDGTSCLVVVDGGLGEGAGCLVVVDGDLGDGAGCLVDGRGGNVA